jgi:RHS repeat-associated protein
MTMRTYFAAALTLAVVPALAQSEIILDNASAAFTTVGTWPSSTSTAGYYCTNYQVHEANGVPPAAIAADNSSGTAVGTWPASTSVSGYYGTNYQTHAAGTGTNTFTWTLNVATAGTYEVYARWTAYPNRATNAKYTVTYSGGSDTVTMNQQANTATWQLLGTYSFDAGNATITLSDDANGYVIADAVMLQPPGAALNTATWTMNVPSAGTYNVYARWTAYPNRASDAKFTINAASGASTITVNQQDGAGGQWNLLGTYSFNAGAATVSLTDQANGYVIADAVMLLPPGSPPNSATWTPNVPQAGSYQVYAWWTAGSNRATNATYTVTNAQGSTPVPVNQQANGGTWNLLGTFSLAPGTTDTITLTDQANGYVIADAIRLVPVQVQTQTKLYFIEVDHLNTPRLVADATGMTVWRWDQQEPFGNDTPNGDPNSTGTTFEFPLGFMGTYRDKETGTLHNVNRDLDAAFGRYLQSDPIGLNGGLNTYSHVLNDPLLYTDPLGLAKWSGTSYQAGFIDLFGVTYTMLDLFSECRCGRKYHILVHAPGAAVGLGVRASLTITNVSFDDGESCPDPTAFLGAYLSANAGATFGAIPIRSNPRVGIGLPGIGVSAGVSRYGQVTSSVTSPVGTAIGRDLSVSGSIGVTFTNVLQVKSCCQ